MRDGRARRRVHRPGDVRLRTVRRRSRGRVRGRSRVLPDDRRAVRLRPLPRPLLPPEVSGPRARPAGRDDEGADLLQLAHRGLLRSPPPWTKPRCPRSTGCAAPSRGDWTRPRGRGRARSKTWTATSSSRLRSLGCRSSRAPIAATSRTGGSRTTRRSSRSLGAPASRSSPARIRRCIVAEPDRYFGTARLREARLPPLRQGRRRPGLPGRAARVRPERVRQPADTSRSDER